MSEFRKAIRIVSELTKTFPISIEEKLVVPADFSIRDNVFKHGLYDEKTVYILWDKGQERTLITLEQFDEVLKKFYVNKLAPVYIIQGRKGGLTFTDQLKEFFCEKVKHPLKLEENHTYCVSTDFSFLDHFLLYPNGFDYFFFNSNFKPEGFRQTESYSLEVKNGIITINYFKEVPPKIPQSINQNRESVTIKYRYSGLWVYARPNRVYFRFEDLEPL